jgi:hypothetical protein
VAHVGVKVKAKALSDERFTVLAHVCGLADADHARGKILRLWDLCAATQHYTLSQLHIRAVLGERGVEGLLAAELGELVSSHLPTSWAVKFGLQPTTHAPGEWLVRMRGTEGSIERVGQRMHASSKGGEERARRAAEAKERSDGGRFTSRPAGAAAGATAGGASVDNPEENLSNTGNAGAPDGTRVVHNDQPPGWCGGNPSDQPSHQPLTRASEIRTRSRSQREPEGNEGNVGRKPARAATTTPALGLRVLEGGAEGSGS